ncbi:hypothetical protein LCGC14_1272970 [marine sediment metagenome]|uniref:Uncharacterized protein n=1 Tax=marine sediment metagenome TaxID=412755 RepID=A0A0F9KZE3_9ZZZZ
MIRIPSKDKSIVNTIASLSNMINQIFSEYNNNINANDVLALYLDQRVNLLDMGFNIDKRTRTFLLNKAMDTTKSDPYASLGQFDPLKEIGELIIRTSLLPTTHRGLESTLWKLFQKENLGSRKRHAHKRDSVFYNLAEKLVSLLTLVSPGVIYPEGGKELPQKEGLRKKLSFKKRNENGIEEQEVE